MTESGTHNFIKNKIGLALQEIGYTVEFEKYVSNGRLDVYGKKGDSEINIEVYKSHISNWIIAKVKGQIDELELKQKTERRLRGHQMSSTPINMGVFRMTCLKHLIEPDLVSCKKCKQEYNEFYERKKRQILSIQTDSLLKEQLSWMAKISSDYKRRIRCSRGPCNRSLAIYAVSGENSNRTFYCKKCYDLNSDFLKNIGAVTKPCLGFY